jgi:hypothetical protein
LPDTFSQFDNVELDIELNKGSVNMDVYKMPHGFVEIKEEKVGIAQVPGTGIGKLPGHQKDINIYPDRGEKKK